MRRFDSVDESLITALGELGAVKLLHDLIVGEIRRLSIPFNLVSVPYEINTPDGGIDAIVSTDDPVVGSNLIFQGNTYYQSKSGGVTFSENGMKVVLCEDTAEKKLKPKIRQIAEANGHLVLFFTGRSAPNIETAIHHALKVVQEQVPESEVTIHIVQAETIIGMLDNFISLRHKLLGIDGFSGLVFNEWSRQPIMGNHFEVEDERQEKIENLKSLIRSTDSDDRLIRVCGYPGVGKTRSVLEAVREIDLAPLVLYFDKPSLVLDSNLITELGARQNNEAIIIVDECDSISHTQLVNAAGNASSNIKVVTIYNEPLGSVASKTVDFSNSELSEDTIVAIIESYGLPNDVAKKWEPFCDGSPRVAHMIAENLSRDTGNLLDNPSYDTAMERILANTEDLRSEVYQKRKNVLSWLSLFHKFGWGKEFEEERRFILHKILKKTGYSEDDVETVIHELKKRKVLQGDVTLYISPRLLHIRAWVWWWERYGNSFDLEEMKKVDTGGVDVHMSGQLYEWFTQMFEYAREVEGASDVVRQLLSANGPLSQEPELLEALDGNFFLSLTKADPDEALRLLELWFKNKTDDDLALFRNGRMNLVRCLDYIIVWGHLFSRGADLLLRLAATEQDHTYSNNSEGSFAELFSNGPGKVAPSEAPPQERLSVLTDAITSDNVHYQLMGVNGVDRALEVSSWTKMAGAETQGLRKEPNFWSPKTYGEIYDAARNVWLLLLKNLDGLKEEAKEKAAEAINSNIRGLVLRTSHANEYLSDYLELIKNGAISTNEAVKTVNIIRRYDAKEMPKNIQTKLNELTVYLEGDDLTSRLKRYIAYDSTEDWWGEEEDIQRSTAKVAELVREVARDPNTLTENEWLFTQEARNAHRLGMGLAELDSSEKLFDLLTLLQKRSDLKFKDKSSSTLLSGFLLTVFKLEPTKWQRFLDKISLDDKLVHWYADLCWRSHLNDHNAKIILDFVKLDKVDATQFRLFRYGGVVKGLSEEVFDSWVEYLISLNKLDSTVLAIDLFASYYVFREEKPLPKDLSLRLITSPTLLEKNQRIARDVDYDWSTVAERYIDQYADDSALLLDMLLDNFGEDDTIFGTYGDYVKRTLNRLVKLNPVEAWKKVSRYLLDSKHSYRLELSWLGGGMSFDERPSGAIRLFPKKLILDWIEEDPDSRAHRIASLIPHDYGHDAGKDSWFATIIDRYGEDERVKNSISANFGSEGFSGPQSLHYANKVETVKRFAELHKDSKNIQKWANGEIGYLNERIKAARLNEERNDY